MGIYLSYHMFKDFKECPLRYYWRNTTKRCPTVADVPQNKILGIVWNKALEVFYRDQKYLLKERTREWLRGEVCRVFSQQEMLLRVKWKEGERAEFKREAEGAVDVLVEAIKKYRLLSSDVEVELSLKANASPGNVMVGRLDMVFTMGGSPCIIDFKGTKHRNKRYISDDQLYWYYLLYKGARGVGPGSLGFWLLRFGEIDWIEISLPKISDFLGEVRRAFEDIQEKGLHQKCRKVLDPLSLGTPSVKVCAWCQYREGCGSRDKFEEARPKKNRRSSLLEEEGDILAI